MISFSNIKLCSNSCRSSSSRSSGGSSDSDGGGSHSSRGSRGSGSGIVVVSMKYFIFPCKYYYPIIIIIAI